MEKWGQLYEEIVGQLERQVAGLKQEYQLHIQCQKMCSSCCIDGFKIRHIEGLYLLKALKKAGSEQLNRIRRNLENTSTEETKNCPLLSEGLCELYDARPALCRAYGVILSFNDTLSCCKLNFQESLGEQPLKVLELQPYYELLDELSERLWQGAQEVTEKAPTFSIRELLLLFFKENTIEGLDPDAYPF